MQHTAAASATDMECLNKKCENGFQDELPDNWLKDGNVFELRRPEYAKEIKFGGYVRVEYDPKTKKNVFKQKDINLLWQFHTIFRYSGTVTEL